MSGSKRLHVCCRCIKKLCSEHNLYDNFTIHIIMLASNAILFRFGSVANYRCIDLYFNRKNGTARRWQVGICVHFLGLRRKLKPTKCFSMQEIALLCVTISFIFISNGIMYRGTHVERSKMYFDIERN